MTPRSYSLRMLMHEKSQPKKMTMIASTGKLKSWIMVHPPQGVQPSIPCRGALATLTFRPTSRGLSQTAFQYSPRG